MSDNNRAPSINIETTAIDHTHCRQRLHEVIDVVAHIRHEINNPLTGVLGQAQLLLREDLSDRARNRAKAIEELAMRIRDIVAELREIQR
ncbi:MAG: histidine kinase dimerization/phospho-acceptor domain-containing protein [Pyrinomonadaceae bacterium]